MRLHDFAHKILFSGNLEDKLISSDLIDWDDETSWEPIRADFPERAKNISFSKDQVKFPGKGALKHPRERGKALHFFANHELLAIEMMAQALLLFPDLTLQQKKLLVKTLSEEQKHFQLYRERMKDFQVEFGDFPLNSFFWTFMENVHTHDEFFAVISLTFEQANLDFANYYKGIFADVGDEKTAEVLNVVYEDEIKHVARGRHEITQSLKISSKEASDLWDYYCEILPPPLTPSRAKGMIFDESARSRAGLPSDFISSLLSYKNDFAITQRKQWEK